MYRYGIHILLSVNKRLNLKTPKVGNSNNPGASFSRKSIVSR